MKYQSECFLFTTFYLFIYSSFFTCNYSSYDGWLQFMKYADLFWQFICIIYELQIYSDNSECLLITLKTVNLILNLSGQ